MNVFRSRYGRLPPAVTALTLVFAALMQPVMVHGASLARLRSSPHRFVAALPDLYPYAGTAETSGGTIPNSVLPAETAHDVGHRHNIITWAVADATHFRVDVHIQEPVLDSQDEVFAANGASLVWYVGLAHRAQQVPITSADGPGVISHLLSGGAMVPQVSTLAGILDAYRHARPGARVRSIGKKQILGRVADVIEIKPLATGTQRVCSSTTGGKQRCVDRPYAYGRMRIWVDDEHLTLLRYVQSGLPAQFGGNAQYNVRSIQFGRVPSADALSYVPPVPVETPPSSYGGGNSGAIGPGKRWIAPPGFIDVGPPVGPQKKTYTPVAMEEEDDPPVSGPSRVGVVFAPTVQRSAGRLRGAYVYVQERKRENGPPVAFSGGKSATAGNCPVWTGRYTDGTYWLGLNRGHISVLVTSNALKASKLIHFAATEVCA